MYRSAWNYLPSSHLFSLYMNYLGKVLTNMPVTLSFLSSVDRTSTDVILLHGNKQMDESWFKMYSDKTEMITRKNILS